MQASSMSLLELREASQTQCTSVRDGVHGLVVEAWGQGFMVGSLVALMLLTLASMSRGVLLHKLILIELVMAALHGTYIFVSGSAFGWYISSTALLLYISYNLHNVVNWIKIKPFLSRRISLLYIGTVALVSPYWVANTYFSFVYNNGPVNTYFRKTRPWEALCREPWWIITTMYLVYIIKTTYECSVVALVRANGRFGVLMVSMMLSIAFIITDVVETATSTTCVGKNPYWKLALVFKCMSDTIFLDDFKSVLDRLTVRTKNNLGPILAIDHDPTIVARPSNVTSSGHQMLSYPESRKPDGASNRGHSHPKHPDTCRTESEHIVSASTSSKPGFEHLETTGIQPQTHGRHQTKDWFDVIDSE